MPLAAIFPPSHVVCAVFSGPMTVRNGPELKIRMRRSVVVSGGLMGGFVSRGIDTIKANPARFPQSHRCVTVLFGFLMVWGSLV